MKTDGELASREFRICSCCDGTQLEGVGIHLLAWRGRDSRVETSESGRHIAPVHQISTARLDADKDVVEGDGLLPERVRESQSHPAAPEIWPHDQTKGLVSGAVRRYRKSKLQ